MDKRSKHIAERRRYLGPVAPRPQDLTEEKILRWMSRIHIGDVIRFDSMKECFTADQVDRHSSTIKADGIVTDIFGAYVSVQLHRGLTEYVNYYGIEKVNGHGFPGYIIKPQTQSSLAGLQFMKEQLWC